MTVSDIIKMGVEAFTKLGEKELQGALKAVQKSVYQRVSRLAKADVDSQAVRGLQKSGGFISAKKGDINAMRSELQRGLQFLGAKTSTITGAREYHQRQLEELGLPKETPSQNVTAAWDKYNQIKEEFPSEILEQIYGSKYKDAAHNIVSELAQGAEPADIVQRLQDQYNQFVSQSSQQLERIASGL